MQLSYAYCIFLRSCQHDHQGSLSKSFGSFWCPEQHNRLVEFDTVHEIIASFAVALPRHAARSSEPYFRGNACRRDFFKLALVFRHTLLWTSWYDDRYDCETIKSNTVIIIRHMHETTMKNSVINTKGMRRIHRCAYHILFEGASNLKCNSNVIFYESRSLQSQNEMHCIVIIEFIDQH